MREPSTLATRVGVERSLLTLFVLVRCVHLAQAVLDLAIAPHAYTRPPLALACGVACLAESAALVAVLWRQGRLRIGPMVADAAFCVGALCLMGAAMQSSPGRLETLNWMLPYSVGSVAGLAFASRRDGGARIETYVVFGIVTAGLAGTYAGSVLLPIRLPDEATKDVVENVCDFLVFGVGGLALAAGARRMVSGLENLQARATELAARTARDQTMVDLNDELFVPVLAAMDRFVADPTLTVSLEREARDLLGRIDDLATSLQREGLAHG